MTTPVLMNSALARGLLGGASALREIRDPAVLKDQDELRGLGLALVLYQEALVQEEEVPADILRVIKEFRERWKRLVNRVPSSGRSVAVGQVLDDLGVVVGRIGEEKHGHAVQRVQQFGVSLFGNGATVTAAVKSVLEQRRASGAGDLEARVADLEKRVDGLTGSGTAVFRCFSGDTYLKLEDGSALSFEALAARHQGGNPLPKVASWDASTRAIVYQTPTRLDVHGYTRTVVHYLKLLGPNGRKVELKVTGEHPMLVKRGHAQEWVKVKNLQAGDRFVGQGGALYQYLKGESHQQESSATVYNFSFSGDQALHPTFLVCMDAAGEDCVVAHNKT